MRARLICKTGQLAGSKYEFTRVARIGTASDNDLLLHPNVISGKHARIDYDEVEKCYFLADLGSRNGTQLDGVTIRERERLGRLHVITFADAFDFLFHDLSDAALMKSTPATPGPLAEEASEFTQTRLADDFGAVPAGIEAAGGKEVSAPADETDRTRFDQEIAPLPSFPEEKESASPPTSVRQTVLDDPLDETPRLPGSESPPQPGGEDDENAERTKLVQDLSPLPKMARQKPGLLLKLAGKDRQFELSEGENVVGRTIECDIFIDDASVSRRHAVLICKGNIATIKDLGSKNHTFLDSNLVESEVELPIGATVRFGEVDAVLTLQDG